MDDGQILAIEAYGKKTGRTFTPGEMVTIPIDALVFTEHQRVWKTLEEFKKDRCSFDPETNDWLVYYVTNTLLKADIPPIYVDVLDEGVAIVDGAHRVSARLIAGDEYVWAQLNQEQ
jgi:hypothetical protein